MSRVTTDQLERLYQTVKALYAEGPELLFHGWHHIEFVYDKAPEFAEALGADVSVVTTAALVHDLNFIVTAGEYSNSAAGGELRAKILGDVGLDGDLIKHIETMIVSASKSSRVEQPDISVDAQALSDTDTLFVILPTTPIIFSSRFIEENNYNLFKLGKKIVGDQVELLERGILFYSDYAKEKYLPWAKTNLELWQQVLTSLEDEAIVKMLRAAGVVVE